MRPDWVTWPSPRRDKTYPACGNGEEVANTLEWPSNIGSPGNPLQYSCLGNPRTEEPGGLQSVGWKRVGHDRAVKPPSLPIEHTTINALSPAVHAFLTWPHTNTGRPHFCQQNGHKFILVYVFLIIGEWSWIFLNIPISFWVSSSSYLSSISNLFPIFFLLICRNFFHTTDVTPSSF